MSEFLSHFNLANIISIILLTVSFFQYQDSHQQTESVEQTLIDARTALAISEISKDKIDSVFAESIALKTNMETAEKRISMFSDLIRAHYRITNDSRKDWNYLDSIKRNTSDTKLAEMCLDIMEAKAEDYEDYFIMNWTDEVISTKKVIMTSFGEVSIMNNPNLKRDLIKIINKDPGLGAVALTFRILNCKYKIKMKTFDFKAANEWYHKTKNVAEVK